MADVKLAIIYYSSTGTIHSMAQRLSESAEKAGAEVRLRQVTELAPAEAIASNEAWSQHFDRTKDEPKATADDVVWADAVLFGSPTRYGNVTSQLKQFIDTLGPQWSQGLLANKAYAGFTASMTAHGGQESTLLALYNTIYHFGGVVVAPGYTDPLKFADGNPYGVSHVTGGNNDAPLGDAQLAALDHLARRIVTIGGKLR
ncbi:NAD(P)H:quinone oxidoreductase type IV [Actinoplanes philippinensis]|uniref:NAD(P)H dehydrogenase (Quinone) n=1 Tax=Actinoplanes philippinensis TaxID=35752 RepID=A0A1I2JPP1_9ACTN|nr:NAD(P)H:quinone oxidoreductase [Actinoplanes philippinensis]GIE80405.1 NAD(P)H:quinone oxidoreductase type IV [Actinoplanes philippinensis]SFF55890.1 NAD(P)H dehydrogenase (quinone) [Actinoplanes philippinensis]